MDSAVDMRVWSASSAPSFVLMMVQEWNRVEGRALDWEFHFPFIVIVKVTFGISAVDLNFFHDLLSYSWLHSLVWGILSVLSFSLLCFVAALCFIILTHSLFAGVFCHRERAEFSPRYTVCKYEHLSSICFICTHIIFRWTAWFLPVFFIIKKQPFKNSLEDKNAGEERLQKQQAMHTLRCSHTPLKHSTCI